ncbi:MAG: sulfatase-like hydrolase/transferase [Paenibacillaceae bacterium]
MQITQLVRPLFRGRRKPSRIERNPKLKYTLILAALLIIPYLFTFGVEFIQRRSIHDTLQWMTVNSNLLTLNIIIDFLLLVLIYCLVGSLIPSIAISALILIVGSLISYFKVKLIGVPFFPWDLHMNKEIVNIMPLVINRSMIRYIVVLVGFIGAIFLMRLLLPRLSLPRAARISVGLLSLILLYLFVVKSPPVKWLMEKMQVSNILWNQQQNYALNGQSLAFMMNLQNSKMAKPKGYGEDSMKSLAASISSQSLSASAKVGGSYTATTKKPNVIFVMNEAFWDPTLMTNVTFSEDPIPTVHQLQKETTSGYMLSPQIGGGTSNVEFEVLTGDSTSFLPGGSIAYQQYIHKPVPSLASYFANQGYKSLAMHSYMSYFYNRENVYKYLGFESFKSSENFINPEYKGGFISDDEFSRNLIQEVDKTKEPMFIYGITMQNHGGYDSKTRYSELPIKVKGKFTPEAQTLIENYTQGAHDADHGLKMLIDHFKQSAEPTIIIFYGDHLPMLGFDYDVFHQSGFVQSGKPDEWSLEEIKKMHSVPFVMWSNMSLPKENVPILSNSFLGAYVLDTLNMKKPAPFAYNFEVSRMVPGLLANLVIDADQNLYAEIPEKDKQVLEQYKELQYDELFGKKFLATFIDHDFLTIEPNPKYNIEFKK